MVNVLHVPAFQDNYIWLIRREPGAAVAIVDPGNADPVFEALKQASLRPVAILCTHYHWDHINGAEALRQRYQIPVYGPAGGHIPCVTHPLGEGDRIEIPALNLRFNVLFIPGHTFDHIAFYSDNDGTGMLFCGDTLFSAGCGRLRDGTAEQLHNSLTRLTTLPDDTRVYCGHEYTEANLRFALTVEPDNREAMQHAERVRAWRVKHRPSLPTTIGLERRINPFLRTDQASVQSAVESHSQKRPGSAVEIFAMLRRWKDGFRG